MVYQGARAPTSSENETVREFRISRSSMRKAPAALRCYRRTAEPISYD
jgi:hypothetical protein